MPSPLRSSATRSSMYQGRVDGWSAGSVIGLGNRLPSQRFGVPQTVRTPCVHGRRGRPSRDRPNPKGQRHPDQKSGQPGHAPWGRSVFEALKAASPFCSPLPSEPQLATEWTFDVGVAGNPLR